MARLAKIAGINLAFLLAFLLTADVISAFFRRSQGLEKVSARSIHATFHHGFIPASTFRHSWDGKKTLIERINPFGMRANKTDGTVPNLESYKTVLLGDSFAEGVGLPLESTLASLIPRQYWPVANLGVISHSPTLSAARINYYHRKGLDPKLIIHLIDPSDIQDEVHYRKVEGFRPPSHKKSIRPLEVISDTFLSSTFTFEALLTLLWMSQAESPLRSISLYKYWGGSRKYYAIRDPYKSEKEPFYFSEGKKSVLNEVKRIADAYADTRYVVVIYRWPIGGIQPNHKSVDSGNKRFLRFKNDLLRELQSTKNAYVCDISSVGLSSSDYIKGDVHWGETGYRKIANYISRNCLS